MQKLFCSLLFLFSSSLHFLFLFRFFLFYCVLRPYSSAIKIILKGGNVISIKKSMKGQTFRKKTQMNMIKSNCQTNRRKASLAGKRKTRSKIVRSFLCRKERIYRYRFIADGCRKILVMPVVIRERLNSNIKKENLS